MDARFKIVFAGELQGHVEAEQVIAHLVATFKLPEAQARLLVLEGNRHVVKKNLTEQDAQRYRSALETAGMIVHLEPMDPSAEGLGLRPLESKKSPTSGPEPAEPSPAFVSDYELVRCPACDSVRVEHGECLDCGVVREKYLAHQHAETNQPPPKSGSTAAGPDPYAAPQADLIPEPQAGEMRGPVSVPAGHGWSWIVRGFWHFKTNAVAWILALILLVILSILLSLVPFVGTLATSLFSAVFTGGLMLGAKTQDEGGDFRVDHLFAGFKENFGQLTLVGLLYLVGGILIAVLIGGLMLGSMMPLMAELDPGSIGAEDPAVLLSTLGPMGLIAILVGALLFIPLVMSFLFAPALVMLDGLGATDAMKLSFVGCLKNVLPFLIYGLAAMVLLFLAVIPLGLGLLVVWPTLTAAIYVAYRDIYFG